MSDNMDEPIFDQCEMCHAEYDVMDNHICGKAAPPTQSGERPTCIHGEEDCADCLRSVIAVRERELAAIREDTAALEKWVGELTTHITQAEASEDNANARAQGYAESSENWRHRANVLEGQLVAARKEIEELKKK